VWQMTAVGLLESRGRFVSTLTQRRDIVPVDVDGGEPEGPPLLGQWLEILNVGCAAVRLVLVVVGENRESAETVLARRKRPPKSILVRLCRRRSRQSAVRARSSRAFSANPSAIDIPWPRLPVDA
jgi:hypothetical protein